MTYFVGVDGGGTSTRAVVIDEEGGELGRAEGPGSVVTRETPQKAVHAVATVVRAAVRNAGQIGAARALWAGLAGAGQDAARTAVLVALVKERVASVVHVGTDVEAAFQDAFDDGPGILLIAGTGSIAWARQASGHRVRVGGWGQDLGDEGSGYWIGTAALRSVVRAEDGRASGTGMAGPVLEHCGVAHARGLIGWVEAASKGEVAGLAPIVSQAARDGDAAATEIIEAAVAELDAHVAATLQKLGPTDDPPRLVLWGGLLAPGGSLHDVAREVLSRRPITLHDGPVDPPRGAASLARALV